MAKERTIRFRGTHLDDARLRALAKHYELGVSAVLRRLILEDVGRTGVKVKA